MLDPERAKTDETILAILHSVPRGAEVVIHVEGQKRPHRIQYPPPADMFQRAAIPLAVPIPDRPPSDETKREKTGGVQVTTDWSQVTWPGVGTFLLNAKQAAVVRLLYEAFMDGIPDVRESVLLGVARKAGSDAQKLRQVFLHNQAWGKLIVQGQLGGTYRLPEITDDE